MSRPRRDGPRSAGDPRVAPSPGPITGNRGVPSTPRPTRGTCGDAARTCGRIFPLREQRRMGPGLDDAPLLQHQNPVRQAHRREPMRNEDGGAAFGELPEPGKDPVLGDRIEVRGGFVENEQGRRAGEGAGRSLCSAIGLPKAYGIRMSGRAACRARAGGPRSNHRRRHARRCARPRPGRAAAAANRRTRCSRRASPCSVRSVERRKRF